MKKIKLFFGLCTAVVALAAVSCAQKEAPYVSGEEENDLGG